MYRYFDVGGVGVRNNKKNKINHVNPDKGQALAVPRLAELLMANSQSIEGGPQSIHLPDGTAAQEKKGSFLVRTRETARKKTSSSCY